MSFGYIQLYSNGINSNSQLRRSTDLIYQRGATYQVILTGTSFQQSMELDVDIYKDDAVIGRMTVVPSNVSISGSTYIYTFSVRPYSYVQNYVSGEHYQYYWLNDWHNTTEQINWNNPYPNVIKCNFKYQWRYILNGVVQYEGGPNSIPTNDYNHYTNLPYMNNNYDFSPSGFTNTGKYFNYVGGAYQLDESIILQNFDQEVGSTVVNNKLYTLDNYRTYSPTSQFLMDYPSLPEQSETGRFLTDAPRIQEVQVSDNYVLYYLNGQTGDRQVIEADYAVFEFYDENNNLVTSFNQELNFSGTTYASPTGYTDTLTMFALPCGPVDIHNIFSNITWSNVAYYRVQLFYSYPTWNTKRATVGPVGPVSEAFYFYLYNNCQPEDYRVVWLNNRGGYDYFTFRSYKQETYKIKRETYDSRYYSTDIASADRNVARTLKTFATDVDQEVVIESYYLNLAQAQWIEQLFYSPQVYYMQNDFISVIDKQNKVYKHLTPLQVISTEVDTLTKKHKKLNKYKITMKTANNFFVNKGF